VGQLLGGIGLALVLIHLACGSFFRWYNQAWLLLFGQLVPVLRGFVLHLLGPNPQTCRMSWYKWCKSRLLSPGEDVEGL
jgi:hypothetical protein